jgi:hypothetical protein
MVAPFLFILMLGLLTGGVLLAHLNGHNPKRGLSLVIGTALLLTPQTLATIAVTAADPTPQEQENNCQDPGAWADWEARVAQHPTDTELQVLHALWIGLCVKVDRGDLTLEEAIAAFEGARETLIQKRWEERREKPAPAGA